jgi:hypothetical protein
VAPPDASGWGGYGLLNYRATQAFGNETLYGSYFATGDTVGVLLDMDHGTISFFKDGEDFNVGKVVVINMGVAYHNLRRNNRSPSAALHPCLGIKGPGDQLSIRKCRWVSNKGLGPSALLKRALQAKHIISSWRDSYILPPHALPAPLVSEMYRGYLLWRSHGKEKIKTRPGLEVEIDKHAEAIQRAAGPLAETYDIRPGKRVRTRYGEARIIGARRGQIWYLLDSGEMGAWYWTRDELSDLINSSFVSFDLDDDVNATANTAATATGTAAISGASEASADTSSIGETPLAATGNNESEAIGAETTATEPTSNAAVSSSPSSAPIADITSGTAPSSDSASAPTSDDTKQASVPEGPPVLSFSEFSDSLLSSKSPWIPEEDEALVRLVNTVADKLNGDSLRISAQQLEMERVARNVLPRRTPAEVQARYSALCVLNKATAIALPLSDFGRLDGRIPFVTTNIERFSSAALVKSSVSSLALTDSTTTMSPSSLNGGRSSRRIGSKRFADTPGITPSGKILLDIKKTIFTRTKLGLWSLALTETTTPTGAPPDEYERPDDLREISVNRIEARNLSASSELSAAGDRDAVPLADRLRISVFGQLMEGMRGWDERSLRRSFIHMQDSGQARAFFVKFTGEGVDDHGGPYRAAFHTAVGEEPSGSLGLLVPCMNARTETGENRDRMVLNLDMVTNLERLALYSHMGRLIGMACRHSIMLPLSLPQLIWKPLASEDVGTVELQATDLHTLNSMKEISEGFDLMGEEQATDLLVQALLGCPTSMAAQAANYPTAATMALRSFITGDSSSVGSRGHDLNGDLVEGSLAKSVDDSDQQQQHVVASREASTGEGSSDTSAGATPTPIPAMSNTATTSATANATATATATTAHLHAERVKAISELVIHSHLTAHSSGLAQLYSGMATVLPAELFAIFTASELEALFCGQPEVDIEVLQKATVYEGVSATDRYHNYTSIDTNDITINCAQEFGIYLYFQSIWTNLRGIKTNLVVF